MKIIIVGLGKVGYAIAQQMVGEEHDLILVDESAAVIEHADATLDAMCVEGNGACAPVCATPTWSSPPRRTTR